MWFLHTRLIYRMCLQIGMLRPEKASQPAATFPSDVIPSFSRPYLCCPCGFVRMLLSIWAACNCRKERLRQLKQAAQRPRFGSLGSISRNDFVSQVTEGSRDNWVVVLLHQERCALSQPTAGLLAMMDLASF